MSKRTYLKRYGSQIAERDGGWNCHYCNIPLKSGEPVTLTQVDAINHVTGETYRRYVSKSGFDHPTVDHIETRKSGGSDDLSNLVLACYCCNTARNEKPYELFKAIMGVE